ncbi:ATP-binding protein [Streptomyces sp. NBC_01451]
MASIAYPSFASDSAGKLSHRVAGARAKLADWAGRQTWLRQSCLLSVGLVDETILPPKVSAALLTQTVGVLHLAGQSDVARSLLHELTRSVLAASGADPNWNEILSKELQGHVLSRRETAAGPVHALTHKVSLEDSRGRCAEGCGRSKRAASSLAAYNFLVQHHPASVQRAQISSPANAVQPTSDLPEKSEHRQIVARVQKLFGLSGSARPLLSQALMHSSWCYEKGYWITRARQRDNTTLAFLGSQVLNFESARTQALRALSTPPSDLAVKTVPNDWVAEAFERSGISSGLLLGTGQEQVGVSTDIAATAFQAVIGAVYASKEYPDTIGPIWPAEWEGAWHTLVADTSALDPSSALERWCSAAFLTLSFDDVVIGPDHDRRFWSTVTITSAPLGAELRLQGHYSGTSRKKGRQQAAARVLRVFEALAQPRPAQELPEASQQDRELARLVLQHLTHLAQTGDSFPVKWRTHRFFGLHLAGTPEVLAKWAADADEILGSNFSRSIDAGELTKTFRRAYEASEAPAARTPDDELADVLNLIDQVEDPAAIDAALLRHLTLLCALYRVYGSDPEPVRLRELVSDWELLHRGHLEVTEKHLQGDAVIASRERAVLDAAIEAVLHDGARVTVTPLDTHPFKVGISGGIEHTNSRYGALERFCTLWSQVTPTTRLTATQFGLEVVINYPDLPAKFGPLTSAAFLLLRPPADPLAQSIADLLHDIKNQVSAARVAEGMPATTRTGKLRNQVTASEHLDQAQAQAKQLRVAASLWDDQTSHALELGSFLHAFTGAVLADTPKTVSINSPQASREAHVDISEAALRSVLNNLIKNALEAMNNVGYLTIAWSATAEEAVILVSDDGPGLAPSVAIALTSRSRIHSTKQGGNGLGLLGAQTLLHRRGGQLIPTPSDVGTTWTIKLPLTTPELTETS